MRRTEKKNPADGQRLLEKHCVGRVPVVPILVVLQRAEIQEVAPCSCVPIFVPVHK